MRLYKDLLVAKKIILKLNKETIKYCFRLFIKRIPSIIFNLKNRF